MIDLPFWHVGVIVADNFRYKNFFLFGIIIFFVAEAT